LEFERKQKEDLERILEASEDTLSDGRQEFKKEIFQYKHNIL